MEVPTGSGCAVVCSRNGLVWYAIEETEGNACVMSSWRSNIRLRMMGCELRSTERQINAKISKKEYVGVGRVVGNDDER